MMKKQRPVVVTKEIFLLSLSLFQSKDEPEGGGIRHVRKAPFD
jgi:hypothetical protein